MVETAKTTWIVEQAGVEPRTFLSADGTWGGAAQAEQFGSEDEAVHTVCPVGTTGVATRMRYSPALLGDATLPPVSA